MTSDVTTCFYTVIDKRFDLFIAKFRYRFMAEEFIEYTKKKHKDMNLVIQESRK